MTHTIHPLDVILHKRDGLALTDAEIRAFILAIVQRMAERIAGEGSGVGVDGNLIRVDDGSDVAL